MHCICHILPQASERQKEGCASIATVSRDNLSEGGQRAPHVTKCAHASHGRSQERPANPLQGMKRRFFADSQDV